MKDMEEEENGILHLPADGEGLQGWNDVPHPQDDIPQEVIERYMIRDYQRMLDSYQKYKKQADMNVKQIENRAIAIASRRKSGTQELTELKLAVEERDRKINEMYDWLKLKDAMIGSLCNHCTNQRDMLAVHERNLCAQRQQIQSLLKHIGGEDGKGVLAGCEASWSTDRWKQAMVELQDLRQAACDLYDVIGSLPVGDDVRSVLREPAQIIRGKARRCFNAAARIASPALRKEFGAEIIPADDEGNEHSDDKKQ